MVIVTSRKKVNFITITMVDHTIISEHSIDIDNRLKFIERLIFVSGKYAMITSALGR